MLLIIALVSRLEIGFFTELFGSLLSSLSVLGFLHSVSPTVSLLFGVLPFAKLGFRALIELGSTGSPL